MGMACDLLIRVLHSSEGRLGAKHADSSSDAELPALLSELLKGALTSASGDLEAFEPVFVQRDWKGSVWQLRPEGAVLVRLFGTDEQAEAWVRQQIDAFVPFDAIPALAEVARTGLVGSSFVEDAVAPGAPNASGSGLRSAVRPGLTREIWAPIVSLSGMNHVLGVIGPRLGARDRSAVSLLAQYLGVALSRAPLQPAGRQEGSLAWGGICGVLARKLQGPLMSLLRATSSLHQRLLDAPALDALTREQQQAEYRMSRVIDNLMDLSQPVRAWREPTPLDVVVYSALASVRLSLEEAHRDRPVNLSIPTPAPIVWADPVLLSHALINVLGNAFEHSDQHGAIRIGVEHWSGGEVRLCVHNEGRSIPASIAEGMTDQAGAASPGLGLRVVQRLINAMGGRVVLDPLKSGASISIWLTDAEHHEKAEQRLSFEPQTA